MGSCVSDVKFLNQSRSVGVLRQGRLVFGPKAVSWGPTSVTSCFWSPCFLSPCTKHMASATSPKPGKWGMPEKSFENAVQKKLNSGR